MSSGDHGQAPSVVLVLCVSKTNAKARYVGRTRDQRDSSEKFEKRWAEYDAETVLVEEAYQQHGVLSRWTATVRRKITSRSLSDSLGGVQFGVKSCLRDGLVRGLFAEEPWSLVFLGDESS